MSLPFHFIEQLPFAHIIYMKNILSYFLIFSLLLFTACEQSPKRNGTSIFEHEDDDLPTAEEAIYDSIAQQEDIDTQSAALCHQFDQLTKQLLKVNSPDALILAKKAYLATTAETQNWFSHLSENDKTVLQTYQAKSEKAYEEVCNKYEIPASGVIANLENLLIRIEQIKTRQEFHRFQDCRLGMLRELDDIYLCVEHNSPEIPKIKRLAQSLKSKYNSKRQEILSE